MPAGPWDRRDLGLLAGAAALAAVIRLALWDVAPYGDEAGYYAAIRSLGLGPDNVTNLNMQGTLAPYFVTLDLASVFWQRPLFCLMLLPGALVSFDAMRIVHILYASLLAPAVMFALRAAGARRPVALAAAAVAALHPVLVTWGVIAFPDTLMTVALLAGLALERLGRQRSAAAAFVAAAWCKETAIPVVLVAAAASLWRARRTGQATVWPLRLDRQTTAYAWSIPLLPLPLLASQYLGGLFPGRGVGGEIAAHLDRFFLIGWLIPVVVAGLTWPRTRHWCIVALTLPAFFAAHALVFGRDIQSWYLVGPAALALVASALVWDHVLGIPRARRAGLAAGLLVLLLLGIQVVAPASAAWKDEATRPLWASDDPGLGDTFAYQRQRDAPLTASWDAIGPQQWESPVLVDVGWFFVAYPFAARADNVAYGYTDLAQQNDQDAARWASAVETGTVTVIQVADTPLNHALRDVYADCVVFANERFVHVDGASCPGRGQRLEDARRAAAP